MLLLPLSLGGDALDIAAAPTPSAAGETAVDTHAEDALVDGDDRGDSDIGAMASGSDGDVGDLFCCFLCDRFFKKLAILLAFVLGRPWSPSGVMAWVSPL